MLRTTFKTRQSVLDELQDDRRRLENLKKELQAVKQNIESLKLSASERGRYSSFNNQLKQALELLERADKVIKEADEHVVESFTPEAAVPVEPVRNGKSLKEETLAASTEVLLPLRTVPLLLVLHLRAMIRHMRQSAGEGFQEQVVEEAILTTLRNKDFLASMSNLAASGDGKDGKEVVEAAVALYNAFEENDFTRETLKEVIDIPSNEVVNAAGLSDFFETYLSTLLRFLIPREINQSFEDNLHFVTHLRADAGTRVYNEETSSEQRDMVDKSLELAVADILERVETPQKKRTWLDTFSTALKPAYAFLTKREVQEKEREPSIELEEEEEEGEEEVEVSPQPRARPSPEVTTTAPEFEPPIDGVDSVVAPGEGLIFAPLISFGDSDPNFDPDKLPFYARYKALTYAIYLLDTEAKVDRFMKTEAMSNGNGQPNVEKLFTLLEFLTVAFLPQKKPEMVQVRREDKQRIEIDVDVREARTVTAPGGKQFRGMTDLDANIVSDLYLLYITAVRSSLNWFVRRADKLPAFNDADKRAIDRFIQSQYYFPFAMFNIGGITDADMKRLQEASLAQTGNFVPSQTPLPPVDRNIKTAMKVPVRFRMYTDRGKTSIKRPYNTIHLITHIQQKQDSNIYNPMEQAVQAMSVLGNTQNPSLLPRTWLINLLRNVAKKALPDAKATSASFTDNQDYHTLQIFAVQDRLPEDQSVPESHIAFHPEKAALYKQSTTTNFKKYEEAHPPEMPFLPSTCQSCCNGKKQQQTSQANVKKEKSKKKKKIKSEKKEWAAIEAEFQEGLKTADKEEARSKLTDALTRSIAQLEKEVQEGKTKKHLQKHIDMLMENMEAIIMRGIAGGNLSSCVQRLTKMCSSCPAHKKK